jgi:hypothetical protein
MLALSEARFFDFGNLRKEDFMTVRCMFVCQGITKKLHWDKTKEKFVYEAEFSAISGKDEESTKFFDATPYGSIKVGTFNQDLFEPGKAYYVDFIATE